MGDTQLASLGRIGDALPAQSFGREAARYLLELDASYTVARHPVLRGRARTRAISNRRVVITTEHRLEPLEWVRLAIQWPVRRDRIEPVQLVVGGEVVRSSEDLAEIEISEYDLCPVVT